MSAQISLPCVSGFGRMTGNRSVNYQDPGFFVFCFFASLSFEAKQFSCVWWYYSSYGSYHRKVVILRDLSYRTLQFKVGVPLFPLITFRPECRWSKLSGGKHLFVLVSYPQTLNTLRENFLETTNRIC